MKITTTRHLPWAALTAMSLGTASILLATPEASPEGPAEISEFIQMDLAADSKLKDSEITIQVKDGIGILGGSARTLAQSERAASRALANEKIRAVVNQVSINPDTAKNIMASSKSFLKSQKMISAQSVRVDVGGNRVVLRGEVGTLDEKDLAREIISEVPGVAAIDNQITVNFEGVRTDSQISAQLAFMIKDDPLYEGLDLLASVKEGTVTLSGKVGNRGEFDRLVRKSYVTGVMDVQISNLGIDSDLAMEGLSDKDYNKEESLIALNQALAADSRVDKKNVNVGLDEGVVTLKGTVDSLASKDAVEAVSRAIPGVLQVQNELRVSSNDGMVSNEKVINSASAPLVGSR